jgi:predicted ATP-dependent endonuclease of OLD family
MRIELTLKNYRCFADRYPAKVVIDDGFTAFVGVNNAGKSTLLRFLYELRHFFAHFQTVGNWSSATDGRAIGFQLPSPIRDPIELYTDSNDRPLTLEFRVASSTARL